MPIFTSRFGVFGEIHGEGERIAVLLHNSKLEFLKQSPKKQKTLRIGNEDQEDLEMLNLFA